MSNNDKLLFYSRLRIASTKKMIIYDISGSLDVSFRELLTEDNSYQQACLWNPVASIEGRTFSFG